MSNKANDIFNEQVIEGLGEYIDFFNGKMANWKISDYIEDEMSPDDVVKKIKEDIDYYLEQERMDEDVDRYREHPELYI